MDIPYVDLNVLYSHAMTVLDGLSVGAAGLQFGFGASGYKLFTPRWEAKKMRMDQERRDREVIAAHTIGMLRYLIKDGIITVEAAELHVNRVANLAPMKELMKAEDYKTVKEALLEKRLQQLEVKVPEVITEMKKKTSGMLANLTASLKSPPKTA
jgi:hypothetical protein